MKKKRGTAKDEVAAAADDAGPSLDLGSMPTNVVYIGHLPHGFYEQELLGYFSQFGTLLHVRVSRSKRTGACRGYAFLQFAHAEVAEIAARTMDGYFMFKQQLRCRVMRANEVHPQLFQGAGRKFRKVPWAKIAAQGVNRARTPEEHARRVAMLLRRDRKRAKTIRDAGIEYEYQGLGANAPRRPKKKVFKD